MVRFSYLFWGLAIILDIVASAIGGQADGWNIHPEHFSERHGMHHEHHAQSNVVGLTPQTRNDLRTAARYNLDELHQTLAAAQPAINNPTTLIHVRDLLAEIDAILAE